jgi:hypothetical protein
MKSIPAKYKIFCCLQFGGTILSSIGLVMSVYDLASHKGDELNFLNYITVGCVSTSIVLNSLKDALMSNPKIFMSEEELKEYPSPPI